MMGRDQVGLSPSGETNACGYSTLRVSSIQPPQPVLMAEVSGAGTEVFRGTTVVVDVTAARPPHPVLAPALPLANVTPVTAIAETAIPAAKRAILRGFQEVPEVGLFDVIGLGPFDIPIWLLRVFNDEVERVNTTLCGFV